MNPELLFKNYFHRPRITTRRLVNFANDHINRLLANNEDGWYDDMIATGRVVLQKLGVQLITIEGGQRVQQARTDTADKLMDELRDTMFDREDEIRYKLKALPGAIEAFFPGNTRTTYHWLAKERMFVLTGALQKAALRYATELGPELSSLLQDFAPRWRAVSDAQEQQMALLDEAREARDEARPELERLLMNHVYILGQRFLDNPDAAMALFNWPLLWYRGRRPQGRNGRADNSPPSDDEA